MKRCCTTPHPDTHADFLTRQRRYRRELRNSNKTGYGDRERARKRQWRQENHYSYDNRRYVKKYHAKERREISANYIRILLKGAGIGLNVNDIPRVLIEAKRVQLMIQRLTRSTT